MAALGDWVLRATGEVVAIDREDIDKSGRNPKYMLTLRLRPSSVEAPEGATVPAEIPVRIKDAELARKTATPPLVGDRITVTARASGPRPATFYLATLAPAEA
jgi:hypothetical protein